MAHISFFVYLSAFLTLNINKPGYVLASAISSNINPDSPVTHTLVRREFKCQKYADCQISDGTAGSCLKAAVDVFLTPLGLIISDELAISPVEVLSAISQGEADLLKSIARAASKLEKHGFNVALDAVKLVDKALHKKIKAGKTCNKVFKLLGAATYIAIEIARGNGKRQGALDEKTIKLKKNVGIDIANQGQPMVSFLSLTSPPPTSGAVVN